MTAAVVTLSVAVVVLAVLVAGLLRSHAEILRALHRVGIGLDEAGGLVAGATGTAAAAGGQPGLRLGPTRLGAVTAAGGGAAHDITGVTPHGAAVHVAVAGSGRVTLLAFLTSGCTTCGNFWETFSRPGGFEVPGYVDRLVVVTRGTDRESPAAVLARAPKPSAGVPVVMSGEAWSAYEVPVAPYFVLVDGVGDRVAGEGAAATWDQLESLLARAAADQAAAEPSPPSPSPAAAAAAGGTPRPEVGPGGRPESPPPTAEPNGAERSRPRRERADDALAAAGIDAGHPSLRPADAAADVDAGPGRLVS